MREASAFAHGAGACPLVGALISPRWFLGSGIVDASCSYFSSLSTLGEVVGLNISVYVSLSGICDDSTL